MPILDMKVSRVANVIYIGGRPPTHRTMYVARKLSLDERTILKDYYLSERDQERARFDAEFSGGISLAISGTMLITTAIFCLLVWVQMVVAGICLLIGIVLICRAPAARRSKRRAKEILSLLDACREQNICYEWGSLFDGRTSGGVSRRDNPTISLRNRDFNLVMTAVFYDRRKELAKEIPDLEPGARPEWRPGLNWLLSEECAVDNPVLHDEVDQIVSDYLSGAWSQYRAMQEGTLSKVMEAKIPHEIERKVDEAMNRIAEAVQTYGYLSPGLPGDARTEIEDLGKDIVEEANRRIADQNAQAWIDGHPLP